MGRIKNTVYCIVTFPFQYFSKDMGKRVVWLGRKSLVPPFATHWAVRVGTNEWYEIDGAGKKNKGERNTINGDWSGEAYSSWKSRAGAKATHAAGSTTKSEGEIERWNKQFLRDHPYYNVVGDNCQLYAQNFIEWLTDGVYDLPTMEAGLGDWESGANASAINNEQCAMARATTGKAGAKGTIMGCEAEGPSAGAGVNAGEGGYGAFAEASLVRVEASAGPVSARFEPNLYTGAGIRDGTAEFKLLGFGFHAGRRGVGWNTPLGGVNCCIS